MYEIKVLDDGVGIKKKGEDVGVFVANGGLGVVMFLKELVDLANKKSTLVKVCPACRGDGLAMPIIGSIPCAYCDGTGQLHSPTENNA